MKRAMGQSRTGGAASSEGVTLDRYTDVNAQVRHMPVGIAVVMEESLVPDFIAAVTNSNLRIQVLQCHWNHTRERMKPPITEEPSESSSDKTATAQANTFRGYNVALPTFRGGGRTGPAGRLRGDEGPGAVMQQMQQAMVSRMSPFGRGQVMNSGLGGGNLQTMMMQRMRGTMDGPGGGGMGKGAAMGMNMGRGLGNVFAGPNTEEDPEEMNLVEVAIYGLASLYERYPPKPPAPAEGETAATPGAAPAAAPAK